jgi:hypothetical protein
LAEMLIFLPFFSEFFISFKIIINGTKIGCLFEFDSTTNFGNIGDLNEWPYGLQGAVAKNRSVLGRSMCIFPKK